MAKPKIELWSTVGLGIIIGYPTGVLISNQTGGTACLCPSIEGVYLPFLNDYETEGKTFMSPEIDFDLCFTDQKYAGSGAQTGIDSEDLDRLNTILKKYALDQFIKIDESKLRESHEAWIHILIVEEDCIDAIKIFAGFGPYPREGILTWANSD